MNRLTESTYRVRVGGPLASHRLGVWGGAARRGRTPPECLFHLRGREELSPRSRPEEGGDAGGRERDRGVRAAGGRRWSSFGRPPGCQICGGGSTSPQSWARPARPDSTRSLLQGFLGAPGFGAPRFVRTVDPRACIYFSEKRCFIYFLFQKQTPRLLGLAASFVRLSPSK